MYLNASPIVEFSKQIHKYTKTEVFVYQTKTSVPGYGKVPLRLRIPERGDTHSSTHTRLQVRGQRSKVRDGNGTPLWSGGVEERGNFGHASPRNPRGTFSDRVVS